MVFQMVALYDAVFDRCTENSLDPKTTELVGNESQARKGFSAAQSAGATSAELSRAACLAACSSGPKVTAAHAAIAGKAEFASDERAVFAECTDRTLDEKVHHLVSLAVCLVSSCACASGHLVS
jgi:hypothetical protein